MVVVGEDDALDALGQGGGVVVGEGTDSAADAGRDVAGARRRIAGFEIDELDANGRLEDGLGWGADPSGGCSFGTHIRPSS